MNMLGSKKKTLIVIRTACKLNNEQAWTIRDGIPTVPPEEFGNFLTRELVHKILHTAHPISRKPEKF